MKTTIQAVLVAALLVTPALADSARQVVFHLNEPVKILELLTAVEQLDREEPATTIAVVVNGPAVVRLSKSLDYAAGILAHTDWLGACAAALDNQHLAREDLAEGIHYISPSGTAALMDFQEQGYAYIKI
jgi:hypothetical protein